MMTGSVSKICLLLIVCGLHDLCAVSAYTCKVNNKEYNQGERWIENCRHQCTCQNPRVNFVSCRSLCVTWNLPAVCKMEDPAPGKCCSEPKCPSYIALNYPSGYENPDCPASCSA